MRAMLQSSRLWLLSMIAGSSILALEGCDATVRETVLNGVGSAATSLSATFIEAFIQSLLVDQDQTATTVQAILHDLPQYFA